jgi:hypothetical protein
MALFDFFKKKKADNLSYKQEELPPLNKDAYLLEALQIRLIEMGYQAKRHPSYLALIVNSELEIATLIIDDPNGHPSVLHLLVLASHPKYFPGGIKENIVGIGISFQDQVTSVLNNYIETTFLTIINGFSESHNPYLDFTAGLKGRDILWHPKLGNLALQGKWSEEPAIQTFFDLLKEKIPYKLTNEKLNWLKIYILRSADETITGECLFNNELWDEGLKEVSDHAKSWEMDVEFKGIKQFMVFRKCDAFD